jgi:hypothetical protein
MKHCNLTRATNWTIYLCILFQTSPQEPHKVWPQKSESPFIWKEDHINMARKYPNYIGKSIIIHILAVNYISIQTENLHYKMFQHSPQLGQCFTSFLMHRFLRVLVRGELTLWVGQTGDSQKGRDQGYPSMSHYMKLEFAEGFSSVGSSMWTGTVIQQHNIFWQ